MLSLFIKVPAISPGLPIDAIVLNCQYHLLTVYKWQALFLYVSTILGSRSSGLERRWERASQGRREHNWVIRETVGRGLRETFWGAAKELLTWWDQKSSPEAESQLRRNSKTRTHPISAVIQRLSPHQDNPAQNYKWGSSNFRDCVDNDLTSDISSKRGPFRAVQIWGG